MFQKSRIFTLMKWLSTILSIYFLWLSVLPCTDAEECNASIESNLNALSDHHNHSHEPELCSPFCACLCCGQFVIFEVGDVGAEQIAAYDSLAHIIYKSSFSLDVHLAIWQPPKIS